ncbi:glycosyltransferase family 4 protein [uncultured Arcobacter sp.]|uniref:glycosyltransferase family 4 protein n=1 Tax=uncultured Arcobacter sp. TaxID=165434 RepID=UPI00261C0844|nr:glycosyltransferase family 4 protein [uncultured Arcobacter sp.]
MNNIIFFIENYIAGGSDMVAHDIIANINAKKIYLFVNKSNDTSNLLKDELPSNIEIIYYGLITTAELGSFSNSKKHIFPIYILLKVFNLLFRYPLIIFSIVYFYFKFKRLDAKYFISNNGGYPGGEYCRSATISAYFASLKCFHIIHSAASLPRFKLFIMLEYFIDMMIDKIATVICVSKHNANILKDNRNFKQEITVIYNGIKLNEQKKYNFSEKVKLLNVASLYSLKNQIFLVEVFNKLVHLGYTNLELHLVGKSIDEQYLLRLKNLLQQYNLENYIILHGFTNPSQYYNDCDIFLLSSKIEGFPIVTLEAMSIGMPIISTKAGGSIEQIIDGFNGFLVEQGDIDCFVEKIIFFLDNKDQIKFFGENGYNLFNKNFTIKQMINRYKSLILG